MGIPSQRRSSLEVAAGGNSDVVAGGELQGREEASAVVSGRED